MTSRDSSPADRRRKRAIIALLGLATAAAAGFGNSLVSCSPSDRSADTGRPVSMAQAQRLAGVRVRDLRDGGSALQATIGTAGAAIHLTGWIDWQQPLIYLDSRTDRAGPADGLVQAVPDLVAVHLGRQETRADGSGAVDPYPPPPVVAPTDGWRVRRLSATGPSGSPFDSLLALLFSLSAARADDTAAVAATGARFLRQERLDGVPVEVIAGPAVLPSPTPAVAGPQPVVRSPSGLPFASAGGQVTYWLDADSRLRRLDALLRKDLPVRVDFDRVGRLGSPAIEPLGGAPIAPRPVTDSEALVLARMGVRGRAARGGRLTVTLPVAPAGLARADGWLDWRTPAAYLAVRNPDEPTRDALVWADRTGVITRPATASQATGNQATGNQAAPSSSASGGFAGLGSSPAASPAGQAPAPDVATSSPPPLRPPAGGWQLTTWAQHDAQGASDLDILLSAALTAGNVGDPARLRVRASWLRTDALGGSAATVYELRSPAEAGTAPGQGLLRYWLDDSGVLRRIEVRTGDHAFGCLDLTPGPVPALTKPVR